MKLHTINSEINELMNAGLGLQMKKAPVYDGQEFHAPVRSISSGQTFLSLDKAQIHENVQHLFAENVLSKELPLAVLKLENLYNDLSIELADPLLCIDQLVIIVPENVHTKIELEMKASQLLFVRLHIIVLRNAYAELSFNMPQSAWNRIDIITHLEGEGARSEVRGLCIGQNKNYFACFTSQMHKVNNTSSSVKVKSVLFDESRFLFKGLIDVREKCNQIHATQINKNSLASTQARSYSVPNLQVKSNGVSCTHASATGPFDKSMIWYARSRGLSISQAHAAIARAFIADVTSPGKLQEVEEYMKEKFRLDAQ